MPNVTSFAIACHVRRVRAMCLQLVRCNRQPAESRDKQWRSLSREGLLACQPPRRIARVANSSVIFCGFALNCKGIGGFPAKPFFGQFGKGAYMKVITISREYGAGGHTIGRQVAQRLGIEFYDRDIILNTARESGLDIEQIIEEEEVMRKRDSLLRAIRPAAFDVKDTVFEYERRAIVKLASKNPCVILGRCASVALEDAGIKHMGVFLFADEEHRVPRVMELLETDDPEQAKRAMRKIDSGRHAYYECYTGRHWGTIHEYDLSLNTGSLGIDACADIIVRAAETL